MSMNGKNDELDFVHIKFKFILEIINGDFYQRVSYMGTKPRVGEWTAVKFLEVIDYKFYGVNKLDHPGRKGTIRGISHYHPL